MVQEDVLSLFSRLVLQLEIFFLVALSCRINGCINVSVILKLPCPTV